MSQYRKKGEESIMGIRKEKCPVCNSSKYEYVQYTEWGIGVVERHGLCPQCGYIVEQAYSEPIDGFVPPIKKGFKGYKNQYITKNIRKRKRYKRKYNIKYGDKDWMVPYIF